MSGSLTAQFWIFVLSGIVVSWVPLLAGFLVRHRKLIEHIDRITDRQTGDIRQITDRQTGTIEHLTEDQTAQITERVAGQLLRASGHPPGLAAVPPEQYHEHDGDNAGGQPGS